MSASGVSVDLPPALEQVIPDAIWGALCIYAESRGEPFEGQIGVGNVIRRRTAQRHFSKGTVVSTVTTPWQFSWMNTDDSQRTRVFSVVRTDPAWIEAAAAWAESEKREEVGAALFYHADYVSPSWARANGIRFVKRIGRHLFYEKDE